MKTFLLLSVLASAFAFGQSKDFTKKQAFEAFKKSNVRIALGYKTADFENYYNDGLLTKESLMLNSLKTKELKELVKYIKCTETIDKRTGTPLVIQGNEIATESIKEYKKSFNPNCLPTT